MHTDRVKTLLVIFLALLSYDSCACQPIPGNVIPPTTIDGKFEYVTHTEEDLLQYMLKRKGDKAVVIVESEMYSNKYPETAFASIRILYGWGKPKERLISYERKETMCGGKPKKLKKAEWYFVSFSSDGLSEIYKYSLAEKYLGSLGDPDYVYTRNGLSVKLHNNKSKPTQ